MKTRIISSVIGLLLLAIVMMFSELLLPVTVCVLAIIGVYEFYRALSKVGYKPVKLIGYISCFILLIIGYSDNWNGKYISLGIFILLAVLMFILVFKHKSYNIGDLSVTAFGVIYVVYLLSFILMTRNLENGEYYIWLIFIGAWATDTFAYFTGVTIGKNKLIESISPKKTVEGSIGGIIGCILVSVLYGIYLNSNLKVVPIYHFIMIGLICGVISQIGDLTASAIKRFVRIKDYGNIMPGHGGVLDRMDSILLVAPVIYFYVSILML